MCGSGWICVWPSNPGAAIIFATQAANRRSMHLQDEEEQKWIAEQQRKRQSSEPEPPAVPDGVMDSSGSSDSDTASKPQIITTTLPAHT